ncbi:unnamed protein product [Rotaria sordida]|uniref:Tc1-like transposase DDE domain-containing protein n=1 Tax=Rotaria sordida TaxID=392033 RepID=A0A815FT19_9BILA|nr:unnamed protein product [Rotaria sordida]
MPKDYEFSQEVKQLMFHIINFVESVKNGPVIPLYNVDDRLVKMLDISKRSVVGLKHELHQLRQKEMNEQQQQQEMEENDEVDANVRDLRSRTISLPMSRHRESSASASPAKILCRRHTVSAASSSSYIDLPIPQALPPQKKGNRFIPLLKQQQGKDLIRFEFHKLIQEKLGFIYQRTSKIKIPLDSQAFVAAKAKYFQALEELREANVHLYYHDETWLNLREVKRLIWTLEGKGEIKKWGGRGSRLAVSALINVKGYHIPSVDIWACTEEHNMDSTHFLSWLDSTCATLREEIGEKERIIICLNNATWHNKLTEESIIPKRSSIKGEIQKWLQDRKINFPQKFVKAQLLQLFVRDQNTTFRQNDVKQLIAQYMVAMDDKLASSYFHHVYKVEEMYRTADEIMEEEIEPHIQSESEETDSDDNEENVE